MLVELTAACLMLIYEREIGELVTKDLNDGLKNARHSSTNETKTSDWDVVQEMFKCCGVNNYTDWQNNIPKSCCNPPCKGKKPAYYSEGCLERLKNWFEENFLSTGISVIILCIIEVG
ncbi:hypothetical protein ATANTOWER_009485 [Ataeniobius toweri]|uniref:Uncharacterized protein n=1 Tax=Ataeniobius toweri TaxID=208326 RepID=A0ABU7BPC6_9TELE|nr:hypothetical protein [Ataeniobius toweri]